MFGGIARGVKVTTFYKIGTVGAFFAAIFGSDEDVLGSRRDGHFDARDGHYDSNDHRERKNDGFRVVRKWRFSPPPPPRHAYRQIMEGRNALDGCRNAPKCIFMQYQKNLYGTGRLIKDGKVKWGHSDEMGENARQGTDNPR